ncbi:hypothetical protein Lal_00039926 [Lupinus albus]|nr:hypothetical protein Lal_00039926 [Lupinus albus]
MIIFMGLDSGSSRRWPSCAKETNRRLTPSRMFHLVWLGGIQLIGRAPLLKLGRLNYGRVKYWTILENPRLSERFSPGRERLTWEGEILEYTGRFSPERELSRLGEKYHFGAVGTGLEKKKSERRELFKDKKLGYSSKSLRRGKILRLEAVSVELEKFPRTKSNTHRVSVHGSSLEREILAWARERLTWEGEILGYTGGSSLERERLTWEGEILGYTGRFSPERKLSRLGEKWHFGTVETVRFSLERESLA